MTRNERETRQQLIDPALESAGWEIERELRIGPGRVNFSGSSADSMYDPTQAIVADYLLRYCGVPLAILEAKAESEDAECGVQQASRYADRLMIRHAIATNGHNWILTDNQTGEYETLSAPPSPKDMLRRLGVSIDWEQWKGAFSANFHVDQVTRKNVRPYQEVAIARTLWEFALGQGRALLLMATGTGKTFTVFQLVWKLINGGALKRQHVLFLTDRNSLKDQWMPFEEYAEKSKEFIQSVSSKDLGQLLSIWIDKKSRKELREELGDEDIYTSAFRHYLELPDTDDVDILAKIGFELFQVPTRNDRVARFWEQEQPWYQSQLGLVYPAAESSNLVAGNTDLQLAAETLNDPDNWKLDFWRTALDHYALFGIDDLEQARTYAAPQFVDQFGSFQSLTSRYGGAQLLKSDLEKVKEHLYVPMAN